MTTLSQLILATHNFHKVEEIRAIWHPVPFEILTLKSFPEFHPPAETESTFEANAKLKAKAVAEHTGLLAISDDSGLEIESLQGSPGVYSARYAGENATDLDNVQKVLRELERRKIPLTQRQAQFRCIAYAFDPQTGTEFKSEGILKGMILDQPLGEKGFGYDPIFWIPEKNKSLAQMSSEEKNALSHRGKAFRQMKDWLGKLTA